MIEVPVYEHHRDVATDLLVKVGRGCHRNRYNAVYLAAGKHLQRHLLFYIGLSGVGQQGVIAPVGQ